MDPEAPKPLPHVDFSKDFKADEVVTVKGREWVVAAIVPSGQFIKLVPKERFDAQKALVAPARRPGRPS